MYPIFFNLKVNPENFLMSLFFKNVFKKIKNEKIKMFSIAAKCHRAFRLFPFYYYKGCYT